LSMFSWSGIVEDRFDIVLMVTIVHNYSRYHFQCTLTPSANARSQFVDGRCVVEVCSFLNKTRFPIQLNDSLKSSLTPTGVQDCLLIDVVWQLTLCNSVIGSGVMAVTLQRLIKCFGFGKLGKERRSRLLNGSGSNVRVL
jgi:hypothetical protein